MPKRIKKPIPAEHQASTPDATALDEAPAGHSTPTTHEGKNPGAVALGKLGGKKGGPARAAKLTKEQRSAIAKKAAAARWAKKKES